MRQPRLIHLHQWLPFLPIGPSLPAPRLDQLIPRLIRDPVIVLAEQEEQLGPRVLQRAGVGGPPNLSVPGVGGDGGQLVTSHVQGLLDAMARLDKRGGGGGGVGRVTEHEGEELSEDGGGDEEGEEAGEEVGDEGEGWEGIHQHLREKKTSASGQKRKEKKMKGLP